MADTTRVLSILNQNLGTHRQQQQNEVMFFCPWCRHHKPKLAVNIGSGNWHCWICGVGGRSLFSLLKKNGASSLQLKELGDTLSVHTKSIVSDEKVNVALTLPNEYKPLWEQSSDYEYKHAFLYCMSRNITYEDVLKYQIGYCTSGNYANRIVVPSYDANGALNFFVGRTYYDSSLSYKNPPASKNVVGFESLISWSFPIFICEGVMDAIAIKRNAIPLFGKTISAKLQDQIIANNATDVYLVLDTDALRQSLSIAEIFMMQGIDVYVVRLIGKDPSETGFSQIREQIRKTEKLTFGELVRMKLSLV